MTNFLAGHISTPDSVSAWAPKLRDRFDPPLLSTDSELESGAIHTQSIGLSTQIGLLRCWRAVPHVDDDVPEWTALFVLQSAGHQLGTANHIPKGTSELSRKPGTRRQPHIYVPLIVGQIVLFNAHRTHWMDAVPGKKIMAAAFFDFPVFPSEAAVLSRVEKDCAAALEKTQ